MGYYAIFLVLLSNILIFLYHLLLSPKPKSKHPPGPKPWPIIGHIHLLGNKPHHSITELSKVHGPLMSIKLGRITTIVISSPEIAKEMFVKHDLAFSSRQVPDSARAMNHDKLSMVWLPVCPKWRDLRKMAVIQLFTNQRLDASKSLRQKKVAELVKFTRNCCDKGVPIKVGNVAFTTSLNLLSNTFFSMDLCSHDSSNLQEFKDIVSHMMEEIGKPNVSDFFPLLKKLDLQGVRRRSKSYTLKIMRIFEEIIDERLRDSMGSKDDVLGTLLKLVEEKELNLDYVKHMLMDLFVAGTDTTSSTLEWAMTELIRHPEKMTRAQAELNQVMGNDRLIEESYISKLPYIRATVKETLRLHPPDPFLVPHKAVEDTQLCGYYVPKNAQVWINVWSIGRDSSIWENPMLFVPERFFETNIDMKGQDFELIPFGAGRRICPGLPLAYRMVHLMLATLLHSFNWKLVDGVNPDDVDVEDRFGISLQKFKPLQIIPYPK